MTSLVEAALSGFFLGASLIIAIGAQNAFVLRLGLMRRHVLPSVLACSLSDAVLIAAGVTGLGHFVAGSPVLIKTVSAAGALFLFVYGIGAFRRAAKPHGLNASRITQTGLKGTLATLLALTFLNPHVYLDTVVLLGGLSGRYAGAARLAYAGGAMMASFAWFFALGYGARLLAPLFRQPGAWRILDTAIGAIMWMIAVRLVLLFFD